MTTDDNKTQEKNNEDERIPFDDALRKLVNTPPKPKKKSTKEKAPAK